jgi:acetyl-CoA/propionyl-CoA carboxylase biotin carboxyl carrier protein
VPGTADPVSGSDEVVAVAEEHGLPLALKAAVGGGGRGLKVVRKKEEIAELFDSAVREAVSAFGRGECFVEKFLDKPRHVEAQVLADTHGNVIVVGTRDCSLQRRNQKLVEEAPAPFLTDEQRARIHESAKAICREAGYHGAGTVEYLVGADGSISFLEVNTRLQVEHPVSEETAGIDLVRQQFRIADGEALEITEDPTPRGHAIEFRINAEDAGRNFMPAPGPVTRLEIPQGPGVRWDSGVETGGEVAGAFDSMLAKLIVHGASREEALERARRALDELVVEGMPTVIPFHRAVVRDEAFTTEPFTVHTRWIETEWDNQVPPYDAAPAEAEEETPRQTVVVEVGGRRLEVSLPAGLAAGGGGAPAGAAAKPRKRGGGHGGSGASGDSLTSPMQGTIVKVAVADGDTVSAGDLVVVLEAMKMEQPINAHKDGTVTGLSAEGGATVTSGAVICTIAEAE